MLGTVHLIRDTALAFAVVVVLAVVAWIAIDYGAALIVVIGGFSLVALATVPVVAMYEEEHEGPLRR